MTAYYNEFDKKIAAWLRQLIINGQIADGEVDERSITEIKYSEIKGFDQYHFFAGIGIWSYALRNAGWPDDRPVCTASLPCQPFSIAGNQKGKKDQRHLLPYFIELVKQLRFDTIFGEQVEAAIKHGWLDDLQTNMETEGYSVGHCVLGAHSVGKAHIRKRLYWVANSNNKPRRLKSQFKLSEKQGSWKEFMRCRSISRMADTNMQRSQGRIPGWKDQKWENFNGFTGCHRADRRMGNTNRHRCQPGSKTTKITGYRRSPDSTGGVDWLYCRDNKYRPIKSGITPLVDGDPRGVVHSCDSIITPNKSSEARVTRIKGYGNAIVAPLASEFISAFMEIIK